MVCGAALVVDCLRREGVEVVFGLPGGAVLALYDELRSSDIRHVLMRHETAAGHAADGYARVSGKPGVVLVTSGPAVTNLITALQNALMDSVPLVALTGQVPTHLLGTGAFQEADNIALTRACTKHSILVRHARDIPDALGEAFRSARSGRPGPVLVDLPKDVLAEVVTAPPVNAPSAALSSPQLDEQLSRAARSIASAERGVICAGGGAILSGAAPQLLSLAERLRVPVTTTLMGLGVFPTTHPLSLGMVGMHGAYCANLAVHHSDCLLGLGLRFDDRVTGNVDGFAPGAEIIQVDIDPTSISRNLQATTPIVADVREALQGIAAAITDPVTAASRDNWLLRIERWRAEYSFAYAHDPTVIKPQYVVEEISRLVRGEAIVVTGVGQHQMWAAQHLAFTTPRRWCTSGGLGAMGYGLPAGLGAQIAAPERMVVNIDGDGSFLLSTQEMSTLVENRLPVKTVILNNGFHGMVRQWQEIVYGGRYSAVDLAVAPDFVKLAEAYGCPGLRAMSPEQVRPTLERAFGMSGPVVVDVRVDREESVFPMVLPGASNHEMILGRPDRR